MEEMLLEAIVSTGLLCFQTLGEATDPFTWMPLGDYVYISSVDQKNIKKMSGRDYYPLISDIAFDEGREPLPESLRGDIERKLQCRLMKFKQNKEKIIEEYPDWIKALTVRNTGAFLWVYSFSSLNPLVQECVQSGSFLTTGHTISGRPIYTFKAAGREEMLFTYATPSQELLVSSEEEFIWRMFQAGMGFDLSILDGDDYLDLFEMVPDLGERWDCTVCIVQQREKLERMQESDAPQELIERNRELIDTGERYGIVSWYFGEGITMRKLTIYGSEKEAERDFREMYNSAQDYPQFPAESAAYFEKEDSILKRRLEKNQVITEMTWDTQLWQERITALKALHEKKKEKD
jgi:hypothetical protein